jgi:hypothetical protein
MGIAMTSRNVPPCHIGRAKVKTPRTRNEVVRDPHVCACRRGYRREWQLKERVVQAVMLIEHGKHDKEDKDKRNDQVNDQRYGEESASIPVFIKVLEAPGNIRPDREALVIGETLEIFIAGISIQTAQNVLSLGGPSVSKVPTRSHHHDRNARERGDYQ